MNLNDKNWLIDYMNDYMGFITDNNPEYIKYMPNAGFENTWEVISAVVGEHLHRSVKQRTR